MLIKLISCNYIVITEIYTINARDRMLWERISSEITLSVGNEWIAP